MFHQFLHGAKPALTDAVESIFLLHLEMLVLIHCLQSNGEVVWLKREKTKSIILVKVLMESLTFLHAAWNEIVAYMESNYAKFHSYHNN